VPSKIIDNGVDVCKPVGCHSINPPVVIITNYDESVKQSDTISVEWDILNLPEDAEITSNKLKWSSDPSDLINEATGSGNGPYVGNFSAGSSDGAIYFRIETIIDKITFLTAIFNTFVSGSSSSSSSRIAIPAVVERI
jgi:hypothetical protein